MAKIKTVHVLALVALCQSWNHVVLGQDFTFDDNQLETSDGKWTVDGTVALKGKLKKCVNQQVDIQVVANVCSVDLETCSSDTEGTAKSDEPCFCSKKSGNSYSLRVQPLARSAHSGLKLQASITSKNTLNPAVIGTAAIGQMPDIDDLEGSADNGENILATAEIDGDGKTNLTKQTVLYLCNRPFNEIIFCVQNKSSKAKLNINFDGMLKTTSNECVKLTESFDFDARSYTIKFTHEDESGSDEFILPAKRTVLACSSADNGYSAESSLSSLSVPETTSSEPLISVCVNEEATDTDDGLILVRRPDGNVVLCETQGDGGKWTVIQRRMDDKVNFFRDMKAYVEGFGTYPDEIWFGLENLHQLCQRECQLRFDFGGKEDYVGSYWAVYESIKVLGAEEKYQIIVNEYYGTAGNDFDSNKDYLFATKDDDINTCAKKTKSGWWFVSNCKEPSNINGFSEIDPDLKQKDTMQWKDIALTYSGMKVRPIVPLTELCIEEMEAGSGDRILVTRPDGVKFACETKSNAGGWTIIQRRASVEVDFDRNIEDYVSGFGDVGPAGTFWWGLEKLAKLCAERCELRVDMLYGGEKKYAQYNFFKIKKDSTNKYSLDIIDGYSGTAGDDMPDFDMNYRQPSAKTTDLFYAVNRDTNKCASKRQGGWWFKDSTCSKVNPNGNWGEQNGRAAMSWNSLTGPVNSLDFIEMKVRPISVDGPFKPLISECYGADIKETGDIAVIRSKRRNIPLVCLLKDNKKWTLIQQRVIGDVDFNRTYEEYKKGFGNMAANGDFWIGLENIFDMCNVYSKCELYINFGFEGANHSETFNKFYLFGNHQGYKIYITHIHGEMNKNAARLKDKEFSTYDFQYGGPNTELQKCAKESGGGWWYDKSISEGCRDFNPNGVFNSTGKSAVSFAPKTGHLKSSSFMNLWVTNTA